MAREAESRAKKEGLKSGLGPGVCGLQKEYRRLGRDAGRTPVVLVVCVPNAPYAEAVERRLRDRAAVVHALAAEGYMPEESTQLQYATVGPGNDELLPCEGFVSRFGQDAKPPVFVLWLADGVLGRNPLEQFAQLTDTLTKPGSDRPISSPEASVTTIGNDPDPSSPDTERPHFGLLPDVRILGPSNSLQYRLLLEAVETKNSGWNQALRSTQIFSCKASAPESVLAARLDWLKQRQCDIAGANAEAASAGKPETGTGDAVTRWLGGKDSNFKLERTICADDQLAAVLWEELKQRGVKPGR